LLVRVMQLSRRYIGAYRLQCREDRQRQSRDLYATAHDVGHQKHQHAQLCTRQYPCHMRSHSRHPLPAISSAYTPVLTHDLHAPPVSAPPTDATCAVA
jgi:hypothetical protein